MAKNKMKSHRGACKRMKVTGSGKVKRNKAYKSHILTKTQEGIKAGKGLLRSKEQAVQGSKPCGNESVKKRICRQKAEKETVQTAVDSKNKCWSKNERLIIQQTYART